MKIMKDFNFVGMMDDLARSVRNLISCVDKLRGYKCRRIRLICYYHSFCFEDVLKIRWEFEHGNRKKLLYVIERARGVVKDCYKSGFLQHGTEEKAMLKTLDIYENIVRRYWFVVCLYDWVHKK